MIIFKSSQFALKIRWRLLVDVLLLLNHHINYLDVATIRQGKVFDIELKDINEAKAKALLDEIARKILANPIIEEYAIEWD